MKKADEWFTEERAPIEFDRLVNEHGKAPETLRGKAAADLIGVEPNGEFYRKFNAWKRAYRDRATAPYLEVPPQVVDELSTIIATYNDELLKAVLKNYGSSTGIMTRAADMRVTDAERKVETAEQEIDELTQALVRAEGERDAVREQVRELEVKLASAKARIAELVAKSEGHDGALLKLRDELIARMRPAKPSSGHAPPKLAGVQAAKPANASSHPEPLKGEAMSSAAKKTEAHRPERKIEGNRSSRTVPQGDSPARSKQGS